MTTEFYSKLWYRLVSAWFCTAFAAFSAILGPLFLFGVLEPANGKPGTDAGIGLSIMSVFFGLFAALAWFNVVSRRVPLLKLRREAIQITVVGRSSLDAVPLLPSLLRAAWLLVSLQGFRNEVGWISWDLLRGVRVERAGWSRFLIIEGLILYPDVRANQRKARYEQSIEIADAESAVPLEQLASAITSFQLEPNLRATLPSLHEGRARPST
jgi:hypothetical protein